MKNKGYYYLIGLFFLIVLFRLFMIWDNSYAYQEKLEERKVRYVYGYNAPRGRILDTNGNVLVDNIGIKSIFYNKIKGISTKEEIEICKTLASILSIKDGSINDLKRYYLVNNNDGVDLITDYEYKLLNERKIDSKTIYDIKLSRITPDMLDSINKKEAYIYSLMNDGYSYQKKLILSKVTESEYAKVMESNLKGITGEITWERIYLYDDTLKDIFGSIGSITRELKDNYLSNGYELSDMVGRSGLEYQYEDYLRGKKAKYLVNSDNTLTLVKEEEKGYDLVLSIDIELQKKIEDTLKDKILEGKKNINTEYYQDSYAIISNPFNGSIIALSGMRLNKNNTWSDISLNVINKSYTIGSAVKGATIAVGYKNNLIEKDKYITDSCVKLYMVPEKCSFKRLGRINDLTALAYSSNYYQYLIAIKLTNNTYSPNMKLNATENHFKIYRDMLASFGLGVITGIDLPDEQTGIIGKKISDDLLLNLSIGQYDTYTPIEVLQYINSVATSSRIAPSLMKEIKKDNEIIKVNKINKLNDIDLDEEYIERIKKGMELVLSIGTGKSYVSSGNNFAGKTGTSESFLDSNNDGVVDVATITSTFTGFYPSEDPKYSVVVITPNISHHNGSREGMYYGASKITKEITDYLVANY